MTKLIFQLVIWAKNIPIYRGEIQYWELPELGVGYHQINIAGMDEAGNLAGSTIGIAIAPPIARNLEIIDIKSASTDVEPGINQFWITVQNNGASSTEFILCSDDACVDSIVALPVTPNSDSDCTNESRLGLV